MGMFQVEQLSVTLFFWLRSSFFEDQACFFFFFKIPFLSFAFKKPVKIFRQRLSNNFRDIQLLILYSVLFIFVRLFQYCKRIMEDTVWLKTLEVKYELELGKSDAFLISRMCNKNILFALIT